MTETLNRIEECLRENWAVESTDIRALLEYKDRLERALLIIEDITAHAEELPKYLNTDKERELHSAITACYRCSHVARLPICMKVHDNWEKEFQDYNL